MLFLFSTCMSSLHYLLTRMLSVSKSYQFTGQNNGKEVFTRKTERPDNGEAYSLEEIQMHRQRHVELEKEFILSTLTTLLKTTGNKVRGVLCLYLKLYHCIPH